MKRYLSEISKLEANKSRPLRSSKQSELYGEMNNVYKSIEDDERRYSKRNYPSKIQIRSLKRNLKMTLSSVSVAKGKVSYIFVAQSSETIIPRRTCVQMKPISKKKSKPQTNNEIMEGKVQNRKMGSNCNLLLKWSWYFLPILSYKRDVGL